jgi:hypothetical protein
MPDLDRPGQALDLRHTPSVAVVRLLGDLVDSGLPGGADLELRDPRIEEHEWKPLLAKEIALLSAWAARRALAAATGAASGPTSWAGTGRALSLVPRHGHAVHLLRRAVPFALCGVPTEVVGHDHQEPLLRKKVAVLRDLVRISPELLSVAKRGAREEVRGCGGDDLVVATGHRYTCSSVLSATKALVLGAAGSCVLAVGSDRHELAALAARLRERDHEGSCTRFGGAWLAGGTEAPLVPRETLSAVHPSVVYLLDGPERQEIHGYTALRANESGAVGALTGFGRDPRYGWPGDFLV